MTPEAYANALIEAHKACLAEQGRAIVPVKPTPAMLEAAMREVSKGGWMARNYIKQHHIEAVWAAMINAVEE